MAIYLMLLVIVSIACPIIKVVSVYRLHKSTKRYLSKMQQVRERMQELKNEVGNAKSELAKEIDKIKSMS